MAKYTSRTGKDVVLKFKGIDITIPAKGYYESQAEDLETLFPAHVRKVELAEIIREIERRLLPPNIKEISTPEIVPIKITTMQQILLTPIKEVVLKPESNKLITETINNIMSTTNDPDLTEFLGMIRDILSSDK